MRLRLVPRPCCVAHDVRGFSLLCCCRSRASYSLPVKQQQMSTLSGQPTYLLVVIGTQQLDGWSPCLHRQPQQLHEQSAVCFKLPDLDKCFASPWQQSIVHWYKLISSTGGSHKSPIQKGPRVQVPSLSQVNTQQGMRPTQPEKRRISQGAQMGEAELRRT